MVEPRYARTYIDRLYEAKDVFALHGVISVVARSRPLPEQFSVFLRLWDWCGSTRSGIWQYYESVSPEEFGSLARALERFELREVAERYRSGKTSWNGSGDCGELDRWIESNWRELETAAFRLIADGRDHLSDA